MEGRTNLALLESCLYTYSALAASPSCTSVGTHCLDLFPAVARLMMVLSLVIGVHLLRGRVLLEQMGSRMSTAPLPTLADRFEKKRLLPPERKQPSGLGV